MGCTGSSKSILWWMSMKFRLEGITGLVFGSSLTEKPAYGL